MKSLKPMVEHFCTSGPGSRARVFSWLDPGEGGFLATRRLRSIVAEARLLLASTGGHLMALPDIVSLVAEYPCGAPRARMSYPPTFA